jgi:hypothetical protein
MHRVGSLWWWVGVRSSQESLPLGWHCDKRHPTSRGWKSSSDIRSLDSLYFDSVPDLCLWAGIAKDGCSSLLDAGGAAEPVSDDSSSPLEGFVFAVDAG